LVLFAAERKEGFGSLAFGKTFLRDCGFTVGKLDDFLLILVELVALDFHVQDGSGRLLVRLNVGRVEELLDLSCAEILGVLGVFPMVAYRIYIFDTQTVPCQLDLAMPRCCRNHVVDDDIVKRYR